MRFITCLSFLIIACQCYAQQKIAEPEYLQDAMHDSLGISAVKGTGNGHYEHDNEIYIAYDAWLDGFVTDNTPFVIEYYLGVVKIGDTFLPNELNDKYALKANQMFDRMKLPADKRKFKVFSTAYKFRPVITGGKVCFSSGPIGVDKDY